MSRIENLDNAIWSNPEFAALSPEAKLVYVWTWSNPRCGMAGLYKCPAGAASFETGLEHDQEAAAFAELEQARFAYYRDGVLFVRSRVRHIRTRGANMLKSIRSDLEKINAAHPLLVVFEAEYAESWIGDLFVEGEDDRG